MSHPPTRGQDELNDPASLTPSWGAAKTYRSVVLVGRVRMQDADQREYGVGSMSMTIAPYASFAARDMRAAYKEIWKKISKKRYAIYLRVRDVL